MDSDRTIITKSAKETQEFGRTLANSLINERSVFQKPHIVCLYGDLGSGKTTFVQGVAKRFGITSRLLSPTFIIVRRYQLVHSDQTFYHIDLYRMHNDTELEGLGLEEIFSDPSAIIFIEWAERLGNLLSEQRVDIHFEIVNEMERKIMVKEVRV